MDGISGMGGTGDIGRALAAHDLADQAPDPPHPAGQAPPAQAARDQAAGAALTLVTALRQHADEEDDGTTLYVSSKDKALLSSGTLHGAPRAGFAPPLTLVDGIHTIETGSVGLSLLGHGYHAQARPVLADIHELLHGARHPSARMSLRQGPEGPSHWIFRD
jgi:hypothetical protein